MTDISKIREIEEQNKQRFLRLNSKLNNDSGIYILYREENGFKFAYVGQARHILARLAQHFVGFQHIDISLKKHGIANEKPYGYRVFHENCPISQLDERERYWIKYMANCGYQLRNKTLGGQDKGKGGLDNQKASRGYHDGLAQGRKSLAKELTHIIETHHFEIKPQKENKVTQKALEKFWELLNFKE